jgi:signal transduction histidine kinase
MTIKPVMTQAHPLRLTPDPVPANLSRTPSRSGSIRGIEACHNLNADEAIAQLIEAIDVLQHLDADQLSENHPQTTRKLTEASRSLSHLVHETRNRSPHLSIQRPDTLSTATLLDAVNHAMSVYGPPIRQRHIDLVSHLDPGLVDLPAGPIYTVLANGFANAIRAMDAMEDTASDRRIELKIFADRSRVFIKLTDTGCGLSPQHTDRHGQMLPGHRAWTGGHGIGLGVCRQIARELDGQLSLSHADPDHPSRGATLTLSYPVEAAQEAA